MIERDFWPFTIGHKAWLFSNSVAGADASAVIYSLMLTCRTCGVEPYAYLRHVLTELPQRQSGPSRAAPDSPTRRIVLPLPIHEKHLDRALNTTRQKEWQRADIYISIKQR